MKKYIAILCSVGILAAGCGTTGSNEASIDKRERGSDPKELR